MKTLAEAMRPFINAMERIKFYGDPPHGTPMLANDGNAIYELHAASPETGQPDDERLTTAHLEELVLTFGMLPAPTVHIRQPSGAEPLSQDTGDAIAALVAAAVSDSNNAADAEFPRTRPIKPYTIEEGLWNGKRYHPAPGVIDNYRRGGHHRQSPLPDYVTDAMIYRTLNECGGMDPDDIEAEIRSLINLPEPPRPGEIGSPEMNAALALDQQKLIDLGAIPDPAINNRSTVVAESTIEMSKRAERIREEHRRRNPGLDNEDPS